MHGLEAETEWIFWQSGKWESMKCFDQQVSNFVDEVEMIQLSRRLQKRRDENCNRVRLQSAKEFSDENAGGAMLGIMDLFQAPTQY